MVNFNVIAEISALVIEIIACVYGVRYFLKNRTALYFKLIVAGAGCFALGNLFVIVFLLVNQGFSDTFHLGYLGGIGCFSFLLSANFGQIDSIIDEGGRDNRKYRLLALIAPVIVGTAYVMVILSDAKTGMKAAACLTAIPCIFCSYFDLKHIIFPDMGTGFVKAIRLCNISALGLVALQTAAIVVHAYDFNTAASVLSLLCAAACSLIIFFAGKGAEKWRT
ncbi:MAG: hypothetical protein ACI4JB_10145 [Porcipelethomonas sp.]